MLKIAEKNSSSNSVDLSFTNSYTSNNVIQANFRQDYHGFDEDAEFLEIIRETFGGMLKKLRVEETDIGLRAFANMIDMKPSNLSNIERGRIPPPASKEIVDRICDALGLSSHDPRREKLFDLAAEAKNRIPADVAAAYWYHTSQAHPFESAYHRTAAYACVAFLKLNGYVLTCTNEELVQTGYDIAAGKMNEKELSLWLEKYIRAVR
jgi:death-on-curing family protein